MKNTLACGDCLPWMRGLSDASVDLAFADPPFNIGYEYDDYDDKKGEVEYLAFCHARLAELSRLLAPTGTFWLAIGDAFASELDLLCRKGLGLFRRHWVVWHFTFGVNCKDKLTPSKTHLLHYTKHRTRFTWRPDAARVPSARAAKYGDRRARAGGRLANDVWALDAKEEAAAGRLYRPDQDVWCVSRVCGTFKERVAHPCQMPLAVLERVIGLSSDPGDLVLDPFAGSGTTLVAARKLGRAWAGCELSPAYHEVARRRLEELPG